MSKYKILVREGITSAIADGRYQTTKRYDELASYLFIFYNHFRLL